MGSPVLDSKFNWFWILVAGQKAPQVLVDDTRTAATEFTALAASVGDTGPQIDALRAQVAQQLPPDVAEHFSRVSRMFSDSMPDLNAGAGQLGQALEKLALDVEKTNYSMIIEVSAFAASAVLALLTPFGAWLVPGIVAAARLVVAQLLARLTQAALVLARLAVPGLSRILQALDKLRWLGRVLGTAAGEAVQEVAQEGLAQGIQVAQGHRAVNALDGASFAAAAGMGAAMGAQIRGVADLVARQKPKVADNFVFHGVNEAAAEATIGISAAAVTGQSLDDAWTGVVGGLFTGSAGRLFHGGERALGRVLGVDVPHGAGSAMDSSALKGFDSFAGVPGSDGSSAGGVVAEKEFGSAPAVTANIRVTPRTTGSGGSSSTGSVPAPRSSGETRTGTATAAATTPAATSDSASPPATAPEPGVPGPASAAVPQPNSPANSSPGGGAAPDAPSTSEFPDSRNSTGSAVSEGAGTGTPLGPPPGTIVGPPEAAATPETRTTAAPTGTTAPLTGGRIDTTALPATFAAAEPGDVFAAYRETLRAAAALPQPVHDDAHARAGQLLAPHDAALTRLQAAHPGTDVTAGVTGLLALHLHEHPQEDPTRTSEVTANLVTTTRGLLNSLPQLRGGAPDDPDVLPAPPATPRTATTPTTVVAENTVTTREIVAALHHVRALPAVPGTSGGLMVTSDQAQVPPDQREQTVRRWRADHLWRSRTAPEGSAGFVVYTAADEHGALLGDGSVRGAVLARTVLQSMPAGGEPVHLVVDGPTTPVADGFTAELAAAAPHRGVVVRTIGTIARKPLPRTVRRSSPDRAGAEPVNLVVDGPATPVTDDAQDSPIRPAAPLDRRAGSRGPGFGWSHGAPGTGPEQFFSTHVGPQTLAEFTTFAAEPAQQRFADALSRPLSPAVEATLGDLTRRLWQLLLPPGRPAANSLPEDVHQYLRARLIALWAQNRFPRPLTDDGHPPAPVAADGTPAIDMELLHDQDESLRSAASYLDHADLVFHGIVPAPATAFQGRFPEGVLVAGGRSEGEGELAGRRLRDRFENAMEALRRATGTIAPSPAVLPRPATRPATGPATPPNSLVVPAPPVAARWPASTEAAETSQRRQELATRITRLDPATARHHRGLAAALVQRAGITIHPPTSVGTSWPVRQDTDEWADQIVSALAVRLHELTDPASGVEVDLLTAQTRVTELAHELFAVRPEDDPVTAYAHREGFRRRNLPRAMGLLHHHHRLGAWTTTSTGSPLRSLTADVRYADPQRAAADVIRVLVDITGDLPTARQVEGALVLTDVLRRAGLHDARERFSRVVLVEAVTAITGNPRSRVTDQHIVAVLETAAATQSRQELSWLLLRHHRPSLDELSQQHGTQYLHWAGRSVRNRPDPVNTSALPTPALQQLRNRLESRRRSWEALAEDVREQSLHEADRTIRKHLDSVPGVHGAPDDWDLTVEAVRVATAAEWHEHGRAAADRFAFNLAREIARIDPVHQGFSRHGLRYARDGSQSVGLHNQRHARRQVEGQPVPRRRVRDTAALVREFDRLAADIRGWRPQVDRLRPDARHAQRTVEDVSNARRLVDALIGAGHLAKDVEATLENVQVALAENLGLPARTSAAELALTTRHVFEAMTAVRRSEFDRSRKEGPVRAKDLQRAHEVIEALEKHALPAAPSGPRTTRPAAHVAMARSLRGPWQYARFRRPLAEVTDDPRFTLHLSYRERLRGQLRRQTNPWTPHGLDLQAMIIAIEYGIFDFSAAARDTITRTNAARGLAADPGLADRLRRGVERMIADGASLDALLAWLDDQVVENTLDFVLSLHRPRPTGARNGDQGRPVSGLHGERLPEALDGQV